MGFLVKKDRNSAKLKGGMLNRLRLTIEYDQEQIRESKKKHGRGKGNILCWIFGGQDPQKSR